MADYIKINPADNVAVALHPLPKGMVALGVTLLQDVPQGHKFTLVDLVAGDNVIKYGYPIGHVTKDAPAGSWIDHSCIKTNLSGLLEYKYEPVAAVNAAAGRLWPFPAAATFKGYRRADGQIGIRNQIWVIPTVGCVNGICEQIVSRFKAEQTKTDNVDAIVTFPHNYGCSQLGGDHENTRRVLADMVHHPNAGGVLVVSLGCENNQLDAFRELVGPVDEKRVKMFACQKVEDEIEYGVQCLREIYDACKDDVREDIPVSELRGGTTVLTEVPEMFGAETILMNRCQDESTFDQTVHLINDFKDYFMKQGMPVYENPSPGNKAGGISTLEEKSLGCTQKCGSSTVRGVLKYADRLQKKGLNLLSAPGNDLVASTALGASGCQMVLFTTGRGTPFGSFVPTMKISTNSQIAALKPGWIDFNAGVLVEETSMEQLAAEFRDYVLAVASGEPVNNEKHGIREIAIFKTGVTL